MFYIIGYDHTVYQSLMPHIGDNCLRANVTGENYLLGYLLLTIDQQKLPGILGSLFYPWQFDGLLLARIDEHISNQLQTVSLGNQLLRTQLLRESIATSQYFDVKAI